MAANLFSQLSRGSGLFAPALRSFSALVRHFLGQPATPLSQQTQVPLITGSNS